MLMTTGQISLSRLAPNCDGTGLVLRYFTWFMAFDWRQPPDREDITPLPIRSASATCQTPTNAAARTPPSKMKMAGAERSRKPWMVLAVSMAVNLLVEPRRDGVRSGQRLDSSPSERRQDDLYVVRMKF